MRRRVLPSHPPVRSLGFPGPTLNPIPRRTDEDQGDRVGKELSGCSKDLARGLKPPRRFLIRGQRPARCRPVLYPFPDHLSKQIL